jgi:hypothetical protein
MNWPVIIISAEKLEKIITAPFKKEEILCFE